MPDRQTTGQTTDAAQRSAHVARAGTARYDYVWPVRTADDHLERVLASRALRLQVYARRGEVPLDLTEEVLAMEVVRLRKLLEDQGASGDSVLTNEPWLQPFNHVTL
jgi:hypothetical protein